MSEPELWTDWQRVPDTLRWYAHAWGAPLLQQQWKREGYADGRCCSTEYEWRSIPTYVQP